MTTSAQRWMPSYRKMLDNRNQNKKAITFKSKSAPDFNILSALFLHFGGSKRLFQKLQHSAVRLLRLLKRENMPRLRDHRELRGLSLRG